MSSLKFAVRTLRNTPFVTIVAILSLALGVGANAAIFSLFNQLLLRRLPVPQPHQLVNLVAPGPTPGQQSCGTASTRNNSDDAVSYTTLGVTPKIFVPLTLRSELQPTWKQFENRRSYSLYLFARLKPGVSIEQAHASLDGQYRPIITDVEAPLQRGMSPQVLTRFRSKPILVEPGARGQSSIPRNAGPSLRILLGVTVFVLLIACANIANLLLARAAGRAGEMAVRLSIGASRWQLAAQLLTESMLLAAAGGAAGLLVAQWTLNLIASMLPTFATAGFEWSVDRQALLFTAGVAAGTGLLFGLFPALHSTRPDLASTLKGQAGQPSGARSAARF